MPTSFSPTTDPLGKTLAIDGQEFQVVGVAKKIGNTFGQSQDNFVYIPIETWLKIYGRNNTLNINVQVRGPEWLARTQEEARMLMRARRHLELSTTRTISAFSPATA